jgi:hypothetical protein
MRAWTTFAVGTSPREGRTLQPLPESVKGITTLDVPVGANASKVATWAQRLATDSVLSDDCPPDCIDTVQMGALSLSNDPSQALAIDMSGTPMGDKMLTRLGSEDGETAWLLFGLAEPTE